MERTTIAPAGRWGRFPLYMAKVGTMSGCLVMVRRKRSFAVGEAIKYATLDSVDGICVGVTPKWQGGLVSRISDDRLFIDRW